jgi:hypothetical protein
MGRRRGRRRGAPTRAGSRGGMGQGWKGGERVCVWVCGCGCVCVCVCVCALCVEVGDGADRSGLFSWMRATRSTSVKSF